MQFTIVALFAAVAMAGPLAARNDNYSCNAAGLIDAQPQCCSTNVLNLAALDCQNPKYGSAGSFQCDGGQKAICATIPILGQGLIVKDAVRL